MAPSAPPGSATGDRTRRTHPIQLSDVSIVPSKLSDVSENSSSMEKLVFELRCLNHKLELVTSDIGFNSQAIDKSKFVFKFILLATTSNLNFPIFHLKSHKNANNAMFRSLEKY